MTISTQALPGVRRSAGAKPPEPPKSLSLLELARIFDRTPGDKLEERIAIATQMKALLGGQHDDFERRFATLSDFAPKYPWPAEAVIRSMDSVQRVRISEDGAHSLLGCGCVSSHGRQLVHCTSHRGAAAEPRVPPSQAAGGAPSKEPSAP